MNFNKYLPEDFCKWINRYANDASDITLTKNENMYASISGNIHESPFYVTGDLLDIIVAKMCNGSIYANQDTLKEGYLTLESKDRVGVVGTVVKNDAAKHYIRDITSINIRIAREIPDASKDVLLYIQNGRRVYNTLIIAPPASGKTTILKDLMSKLGKSFRVGVADERCELAPQGKCHHTFIMKGCSKRDGILSLLRSMAPDIIITDEIGTNEDEDAILKLINAGVKIICSAHGYDETDVLRRAVFKRLISEGAFERIIVLSKRNGPGTVEKIINTLEMNTYG